jgi:uncharacterized protein with NRDE domain
MCLVIVAYKAHADYPLVLAANRDEMYQRATRAAQFWPDYPSILAGQDLEQGGTWLGLDKSGRLAAVTNYRDGMVQKTAGTSRGLLVSHYLQKQNAPINYLEQCIAESDHFNSFNLLLGDVRTLYFLSSREHRYRQLEAGIHGISNGDLDSSWPKVEGAKQQMSALLAANQLDDHERILALLADRQTPADESLPDTGIGLAWERALAPVFIKSEEYGTRASSVLSIDRDNNVRFSERAYDSQGKAQDTRYYEFGIEEQK